MVAVTIVAFPFGDRLVDVLPRKALRIVTGVAQLRYFPGQKSGILALMSSMAAVTHTDLEGSVFFLAPELLIHVAVEAETGC